MKIGFYTGAMYAEIENETIDRSPIDLGDKTLHPGQFINKLGHRYRSQFEMKEGWYLRYVGRVDEYLLFDTNCNVTRSKNMYYCFAYINKNTLLIGSGSGNRDVVIKELKVFDKVKMQSINEQLSLF